MAAVPATLPRALSRVEVRVKPPGLQAGTRCPLWFAKASGPASWVLCRDARLSFHWFQGPVEPTCHVGVIIFPSKLKQVLFM